MRTRSASSIGTATAEDRAVPAQIEQVWKALNNANIPSPSMDEVDSVQQRLKVRPAHHAKHA
ncbi:MAG: hypothetical protein V9H26_03290 [Verrucomicrobiota bacterium]